jgi:protein MpaA
LRSYTFGLTRNQLPIIAHEFGTSGPEILILGGVHGDESEGVVLAQAILGRFYTNFSYRLRLTLVPMLNLDGVLKCQRQNAEGVDLNRNLPTNDWSAEIANPRYNPGPSANSEPENQALVNWLNTHQARFVLSFHSWKPLLNVNGSCLEEATIISKITGYGIEESIGYPTPGCLGTYCGLERDIPTLTYEVERGMDHREIPKKHLGAVLEALKVSEKRR